MADSERRYEAVRLNDWSDQSWAVVERPKGAIALDAAGKLVMRLTKADAIRIAMAMSAALPDQIDAVVKLLGG